MHHCSVKFGRFKIIVAILDSVISESDPEFSLIAAALRVAYLSKMNFPQAKDERQKVLNSTQAKDLDETVKKLLEM